MGSPRGIESSLASGAPAQSLEGAALPNGLQQLPKPPARLFLHGHWPDGPRVAIVGTRAPTPEARNYAEFLSSWLAARGVVILSGGAKGIDAAAHAGALASGLTVVVAPSSYDHPFPSKHRALYADILERGGGYLSRFERDVPARAHQFLDRNGLLVALSDLLILVEAPLRSGARNAGKWARRLGRPYFVVPSPPWNERGRGCILELQLGARPLAAPEEVLQALDERSLAERALPSGRDGAEPHDSPGSGETRLEVFDQGSLSSRLLMAIQGGARHADDLAAAVGVSLPEVNHALLLLTLGGDIEQGAGGEVTVIRR
jgi:DNA processing protein